MSNKQWLSSTYSLLIRGHLNYWHNPSACGRWCANQWEHTHHWVIRWELHAETCGRKQKSANLRTPIGRVAETRKVCTFKPNARWQLQEHSSYCFQLIHTLLSNKVVYNMPHRKVIANHWPCKPWCKWLTSELCSSCTLQSQWEGMHLLLSNSKFLIGHVGFNETFPRSSVFYLCCGLLHFSINISVILLVSTRIRLLVELLLSLERGISFENACAALPPPHELAQLLAQLLAKHRPDTSSAAYVSPQPFQNRTVSIFNASYSINVWD